MYSVRMHCALPNVFSIELAHTSKSIAEQALSQEHARAHTHTHTHTHKLSFTTLSTLSSLSRASRACIASLSLSLSLSHTHTHTHPNIDCLCPLFSRNKNGFFSLPSLGQLIYLFFIIDLSYQMSDLLVF